MPSFRKNAKRVARTVGRGARTVYRGALRAKRYHDDFKSKHPVAYRLGVKAVAGAYGYYSGRNPASIGARIYRAMS